MREYDRKQLAAVRSGDQRTHYNRHEVDGSVTVITWNSNMKERRQNCRTMAEFRAEVTRVLENKQALIDIKESKQHA